MLTSRRVAILGMGTMGSALAHGLGASQARPKSMVGTVRHGERLEELAAQFDFDVSTDNPGAARDADIVLVCTKPHRVAPVMVELAQSGALDGDPLVVSIAAGLATKKIEEAAGRPIRLVRAMPNTPALIREGMTVVSPGSRATDEDLDVAEELFRPLGRVLRLDEEHMDTVTGLAASGPAFVYVMIEALSEGGVMMGLPRKIAVELAAQMMQGAARMVLETGEHPASLKDQVTTPAGCTISALLSLEDGRIRSVLARGVQEAARAAAALG